MITNQGDLGSPNHPGAIYLYNCKRENTIAYNTINAAQFANLGDLGLPTRFFYPLLAPDNKIYIRVSNYNSPYLHTIENPDEPGLACNVQQHSVRLPVFNNLLLPNMPYYRLWEWEDSTCDTLGSVAVKELSPEKNAGFRVYPNPAHTAIHLNLQQPAPIDCRVGIFNLTGQLVATQIIPGGSSSSSMIVANFPTGFYMVSVSERGQQIWQQNLSIIR